jgi:YD repeat-containing protein
MKRNIFRIALLAIFSNWVCSTVINAQSGTQNLDNLKNIVPPSPNSSALGKYADWPVSLYTGIPNMTIPIYEMHGRTINVPISLSYHSSGIKVGETASWVGLGWVLEAGGVITRSVKGLPDDDYYDGYLVNRNSYNNHGDMSSGTNPANLDSTYTVKAAIGSTDSEPDLYMFNAMGRSFKFYFSGDGTILTQPYSKIKINCNWQDSTWKVILEDGTILNFGSTNFIETTNTSRFSFATGGSGTSTFISSWYLKSVIGTSNEIINFSYSTYSITQRVYSSKASYMANDPGPTVTPSCAGLCAGASLIDKSRNEVQTVASLLLNKIENDWCRLDFISDTTERKDLQGGRSLASIKVFSKYKNDFIAQYKFNYHFTEAVESGSSTDYNRFRLRLDSLKQISPVNSVVNYTWKFDYNSQNLPSRSSYAQDHFGYFNGATGNTTLLPEIITPLAHHDHGFGPDHYTTGDRSANGNLMQAEMLTKITYPTGGYTDFEYEPNHYLNTEEALVSGTIDQQVEAYTGINPFVFLKTDTLFIKRKQYVKILTSAYISTSFLQDHPNPNIHVDIKTLSGTSIGGAAMVNNQDLVAYNFLDSGTYLYQTRVTGVTSSDFVVSADYLRLNSTVSYKRGLGIQPVQKLVGGLRIKSQKAYDGISSIPQQINYQYSFPLVIAPIDTINSYLTTLFDELKQETTTYTCEYAGDLGHICYQEYLVRHCSTKEGLGSIQGGPIGYGEVKVLYGSNGENGYTISKYNNENEDEGINEAKSFPYPPVCSSDWRRGLLLEQSTYTSNNKLANKVSNSYQFISKNSIFAFKAGVLYQKHSILVGYTARSDVSRVDIKIKTEAIQQLTSKEVIYNLQTTDSLFTITNYYFDNTNSLSPTRTQTINSKGDTIKVITRTPLEKSDINASTTLTSTASAAIDTMLARNIISPVLQQEKYISNVLQSRSLTNYKNWTFKLLKPENVQLQTKSNPSETRVMFAKYDTSGNLIEQRKSNDVYHSYIWDYKINYPVAECINADSASIAYTSFESDGKGGWTFSGSPTSTYLSPSGKNSYSLSAGNITRAGLNTSGSYIVSYWSKNGQQTVSNTGAVATGRTVGLWTYYEHPVSSPSGGTITVSGSGSIDELRLYLKGSLMTTYTYDPLIGMTSQCDPNNRITYYEYDNFGRLSIIRNQDRSIVKRICYNFAGQVENCSGGLFINTSKSGSLFRNNCGSGYIGSSVTYTVPEGSYSSTTSQSAADQLAQDDVNTNSQSYANANGTCTSCTGSFTVGSGWSNYYQSITPNSSTVSITIIMAAQSSSSFNNISSGGVIIGSINSCIRPSVDRSYSCIESGRLWSITIYTSGQVRLTRTGGAALPNPGSAFTLAGSYSL